MTTQPAPVFSDSPASKLRALESGPRTHRRGVTPTTEIPACGTGPSRRPNRAAAQLRGEDGRGYELAWRLEACGTWRAWLGHDAAHATLAPHLTSPATYDAFLSPAASPSPPPRLLLLL